MARYWIMRRIRGRCTKMTISLRHTVCLALLAQGFLSCTGANVSVQSDNLSTGVYRIPYEDKTQVVIRQDHTTHKPPNRLDLVGLGSIATRRSVTIIMSGSSIQTANGRNTRTCNRILYAGVHSSKLATLCRLVLILETKERSVVRLGGTCILKSLSLAIRQIPLSLRVVS